MRSLPFFTAFTSAVLAYHAEIHPEYQQGLSINDVPAARRLHWMRVANEVNTLGSSVIHNFELTRPGRLR